MGTPQYVDISSFNGTINWTVYKQWAAQGDGISRVAIKASEGTGYTDPHFEEYRAGALAAGIDEIIYYHYARPQWNAASAEADWALRVVGTVRPQDTLMLDYEEGVPQATSEWAYEWLTRQEANYTGKLPTIYASDGYIRARLQDSRLARYPLTLANWQFTPTERPACPPPWRLYSYLQYTDRATQIPGVPGSVDADVYLGGQTTMPVPTGWTDENGVLTAPNKETVVLGFRQHIIDAATWDAGNEPNEEEYHTEQVLLHNPAVGAGQRQTFRDCELWYTDARGVVQEPYPGLELKACYDLIAAQQAQIATLVKGTPAPQGLNLSDAITLLKDLQTDAASKLAQALTDLGA